ncbi:MAG TPA: glycosyltransferase [Candidatus Limnocylindria bacterium]|nr:glycosyltransferase [Candidatus Limnocylindria bacterium]
MRIALTASLVAPLIEGEANGPHSVIVDLARGLAARGHSTTVYAACGSAAAGVTVREIDVDPVAAEASISAGDGPPYAASAALERGFAVLFAAVAHDAPDVVSQHAFDGPAIRLSETLPVIHTLHLPADVGDVLDAARDTLRPLATVSEAARLDWLSHGVHSIVLRNGVPDLAPVGQSVVSGQALICGRVSPEKGTHMAIRAARAAGMQPLVVGSIYDPAYHEREVAPLLREGEFIGPRPRSEVARLMAGSEVLIMASVWDEPFGLVAAEAQMAGCPVVAFRRGALPEIVIEGETGTLVEPDDEEALAAAARSAAKFDRAHIRASAKERLGVERMLDDYERALSEISRK